MTPRLHRVLAGMLAAPMLMLLLGLNPGAWAQAPTQTPPSSADASLTVRLIEFPMFLPPGGELRFVLDLANPAASSGPVSELAVNVSFRDRVKTRTMLKRTFDTRPAFPAEIGSDTLPLEGTIAPGESRRFTVAKPLSEISFFRTRTAGGAYPVRISVTSSRGRSAPLLTHMILFESDGSPPLGLSLVVPLDSPPIYTDPSRPTIVTSSSLETSISGGRLGRILDAIEASPATDLAIAPSGLLLEMLSELSDGYVERAGAGETRRVGTGEPAPRAAERALQRIGAIAGKDGNEVMVSPYSSTVLPSLLRAGLPARAQAQVGQTRLRIDPDPQNRGALIAASPAQGWVLPVAGLLDEPTLAELQQSSVSRTILSPKSLRDPGELLETRGAPVQIATRAATPVTALVSDTGLGDRLISKLPTIESRQGFLAETVTIMLEFPGQTRAVTAVAPHDWNPAPAFARELFASIGSVPWLNAMTPTQVVAQVKPGQSASAGQSPPTRSRLLELAASDTLLDRVLPEVTELVSPPADYFAAIRDAVEQINRFADLDPPRDRISILERQLLIAESSSWWTRRSRMETGKRFAGAVGPAVRQEFGKVKAPDDQPITLTSRTGVIPLSIRSGLTYPVDVVVRLQSSKLTFPNSDQVRPCRRGSSDACLFIDKLPPRSPPIEVTTQTRATGTFPLHLVVETPGGVTLDESDLTIRSTAYSVVALGITSGAAVFMVSWWLAGVARKRIPA